MQALRSAYNITKLNGTYVTCCVASTVRQRCCCTSTATAVYIAPTEAHMQHLASLLACKRYEGDCYCLYGSVGAGKSVFSRAFIRAAAGDCTLPVPSPTYLLQLVYEEQDGPPIHHFDLYRLDPQQDMSRLDLSSSFKSAVNLIEWSERLPQQLLPAQRLEVHIETLQDSQQPQQQGVQDCAEQERGIMLQDLQLQQHAGAAGAVDAAGVKLLRTPDVRELQQHSGEIEQLQSWETGEEEFSGAEDDHEEFFTDSRARRVELRAVGERWVAGLQKVAAELQ